MAIILMFVLVFVFVFSSFKPPIWPRIVELINLRVHVWWLWCPCCFWWTPCVWLHHLIVVLLVVFWIAIPWIWHRLSSFVISRRHWVSFVHLVLVWWWSIHCVLVVMSPPYFAFLLFFGAH